MLEGKRICFIGGGAMAEAMIKGLLGQGLVFGQALTAIEIAESRRQWLQAEYGIKSIEREGAAAALLAGDIVVLAVKPQQLPAVLAAYGRFLQPQQLLISVLAGVTLAELRRAVPRVQRIVRAMPNTSAAVGLSATAICRSEDADSSVLALAEALFCSIGTVVRVSEDKMDAITALSGSGPAYLFALAEAMEQGGVAAGLDHELARALTEQTLLGAAQLLASQHQAPAELRRRVTSPGGTTMAALEVLQAADFPEMMRQAILSAAARSRALATERLSAD